MNNKIRKNTFRYLTKDILAFKLLQITNTLDNAKRIGYGKEDKPEGTININLSDTLAKQISKELKEIIGVLQRVK